MANAEPPMATPMIREVFNGSDCVEAETGAAIAVGTPLRLGWAAVDL